MIQVGFQTKVSEGRLVIETYIETNRKQDPDGEIENYGKSIFEIRIQNFSYIHVIVFDLKLKLSTSGSGWDLDEI